MQINLKRILYNDQRYLSIGRKKAYTSTVFGPAVMNRIIQDAERFTKDKKHGKKAKSNESLNATYNLTSNSCPRFIRNSKRYEDREFHELNGKYATETETPYITESIEDFKLPSLVKLPEIPMKPDMNLNESFEELKVPKEHSQIDKDPLDKEQQFQTSTRNSSPLPSHNNSKPSNNNSINLVIKPKTQEISANLKLKLPRI